MARKTAHFMENHYQEIGKGLTHRTRLTPIILNSYSAVPNGYTALAPRRTEWFMTPYYGLFFGNRPWYKDLAVHEYRHVVQFDAMNDGGIRLLHWAFGDLGQALGMFTTYPLWFFEGDAVYTETVFDPAGRGRSGRFAMPLKAVVNEYNPKQLNYYTFYYQSYKRYYPSHYHLGYYLVSYLHRHPGGKPAKRIWLPRPQNRWDAIVKDASYISALVPFGMHLSLMFQRNLSYRRLADSTWKELKTYWKPYIPAQVRPMLGYTFRERSPYSHDVFPRPLPNGDLVFLRYGFDSSPAIMYQPSGKLKARKIKSIPAYRMTAGGHYAAWLEFQSHMRWQNQVMTEPVFLNLRTGKTIRSGLQKRYTDLALSPDGKYWAAVYYDASLHPHIEIRRSNDHYLLKDQSFPAFYSIHYPAFSPAGQRLLLAGMNEDGGTGLYLWSWKNDEVKPQNILPPSRRTQMEGLFFVNDHTVGWTDDYNGLNIWEMNLSTRIIRPLTRRPYGAAYAAASRDTLWFSDYSHDGFHLVAAPLSTLRKGQKPRTTIPYRPEAYFVSPIQYVEDQKVAKQKPSSYASHPYHPWLDRLKPHSWYFLPMPDENLNPTLMAGFLNNDLLNEWQWMAGVDLARDHTRWNLRWEYKRLFPILGARIDRYQGRQTSFDSWGLYARIPLDFSSGIYSRSLQAETGWDFRKDSVTSIHVFRQHLSYGQSRMRSYRDIKSRLAVNVSLTFKHVPETKQDRWGMALGGRIPGIFRHDYLALEGLWIYQDKGIPLYDKPSVLTGVLAYDYNRLLRTSFTYEAPLLYPDWGWKRVFNLKRLRGGPVAGYAVTDKGVFRSAGLALTGDWNIMGFKFDLPLGIRADYVWPYRKWYWHITLMDMVF